MRVGFTGTRRGLTPPQLVSLTDWLAGARASSIGRPSFHHGDCVGADAQAFAVARRLDFFVHRHPPIVYTYRAFTPCDLDHAPAHYLVRDEAIVAACDVLLAGPKGMNEELRSGTWATVRRARRIDRPVVIFWPDGTVDGPRAESLCLQNTATVV